MVKSYFMYFFLITILFFPLQIDLFYLYFLIASVTFSSSKQSSLLSCFWVVIEKFYYITIFLVDSIVEIIVFFFLFFRSHPRHQLSESISPDIGKLEHLKLLYVFFIFYFLST